MFLRIVVALGFVVCFYLPTDGFLKTHLRQKVFRPNVRVFIHFR